LEKNITIVPVDYLKTNRFVMVLILELLLHQKLLQLSKLKTIFVNAEEAKIFLIVTVAIKIWISE
jgi:hypothetical protein